MSTSGIVTGASDDLIELNGSIRDESSAYDVRATLTFNPGQRVAIEYTGEGIWRIDALTPGVIVTKCEDRPGFTGPDGPIYSDEALVEGATSFRFVKHEMA